MKKTNKILDQQITLDKIVVFFLIWLLLLLFLALFTSSTLFSIVKKQSQLNIQDISEILILLFQLHFRSPLC